MKTQNRIVAIGCAIVCLAVAAPAANGQAAAGNQKTFQFLFHERPWSEVLDWLVEITGLPILGHDRVLTGTVTFMPEVGPGGRLKQYTIFEMVEHLNDILEASPGHPWVIIRRQASIGVYPADVPLPIDSVKLVSEDELIDLARTEFVRLNYQLTRGKAKRLAPAIKEFMSPFGQIIPVEESNQLILIDNVGSLRKLLSKIEDIEALHGGG